jgi:predicted nucleic acid-binding protein
VIAATASMAGRTVVSADTSAFADLPGVAVLSHR